LALLVLQGYGLFSATIWFKAHSSSSTIRQQECQCLLKLHAFGLLKNSFQPTDEIGIVRTYGGTGAIW
jgi:hypothetical protein